MPCPGSRRYLLFLKDDSSGGAFGIGEFGIFQDLPCFVREEPKGEGGASL